MSNTPMSTLPAPASTAWATPEGHGTRCTHAEDAVEECDQSVPMRRLRAVQMHIAQTVVLEWWWTGEGLFEAHELKNLSAAHQLPVQNAQRRGRCARGHGRGARRARTQAHQGERERELGERESEREREREREILKYTPSSPSKPNPSSAATWWRHRRPVPEIIHGGNGEQSIITLLDTVPCVPTGHTATPCPSPLAPRPCHHGPPPHQALYSRPSASTWGQATASTLSAAPVHASSADCSLRHKSLFLRNRSLLPYELGSARARLERRLLLAAFLELV